MEQSARPSAIAIRERAREGGETDRDRRRHVESSGYREPFGGEVYGRVIVAGHRVKHRGGPKRHCDLRSAASIARNLDRNCHVRGGGTQVPVGERDLAEHVLDDEPHPSFVFRAGPSSFVEGGATEGLGGEAITPWSGLSGGDRESNWIKGVLGRPAKVEQGLDRENCHIASLERRLRHVHRRGRSGAHR